MTAKSIRSRLLASIAVIQIIGASLATFLVVHHERNQSYAAFDASLGEQAAVLRSLVEAPEEATDAIVFHREFLSIPESNRFSVLGDRGKKIDGSPGWPPRSTLLPELRSIVTATVAGTQFRMIVLKNLPLVDSESESASLPRTVSLIYAAPIAPVEAHIRRVEEEALCTCLAFLAISMLGSTWALNRGLRPLRELASAAEKIDVSSWMMPKLVESEQFRELRPLASALTDLVNRLHAAFNRERQFFGDAAHEMKSSVAIVRSTLQFALQTERSAAEYRSELKGALEDTDRIQDLVGSMLALARIESMERKPSFEGAVATEIHAQVVRVAERFRPVAGQKRISLIIEGVDCATWVAMSDENLFAVLVNLIENAILYSDDDKKITVRIRTADQFCFLDVIDEGCGISPGALPYVFDRFYRADASRTRATGGAGLGLSIVKALVLQVNGTVSIDSEVGKGTVISVVIPVASSPT